MAYVLADEAVSCLTCCIVVFQKRVFPQFIYLLKFFLRDDDGFDAHGFLEMEMYF
jgi:hypothetical protein